MIGTNASKLLEPWEIVNSQGDGPFAIKTLLGWVVNGDWKGKHDDDNCHFATVNRVFECLELLLEKQYEHDFNEKTAEDKAEMSREEAKFIEIMEQSVKVQYGHYSVKLPFKTKEVTMSSNRVAQQRLSGIRKKMERDKKFYQEYTDFLTDVVNNGYGTKVCVNRGRLWSNFNNLTVK